MEVVNFALAGVNDIILSLKTSKEEFKQLGGNVCDLCMFSVDSISVPVKAIKTGARHHCAKWLLLPACMRARFKDIDYNSMKCSCIEHGEYVFFIYAAKKK